MAGGQRDRAPARHAGGDRAGQSTPAGATGGPVRGDPRDEIPEYLAAMRAFAMSLTRDPSSADDLVQDTVVKAWTNIGSYTPGTNMRAWLFTILRNHFYTQRRRLRRETADSEGAFAARLAEKPAHDGRLALRDFAVAFAQLPDEQREALVLVGASGFSYDEAARMTCVPAGTVKSRANRARRKLAELLGLEAHEEMEMTDRATRAVMSGQGRQGL
ncbi:RNA polymerase sigma factor [Rhodovulum sp. 12E13]|uniref:RNA polymerase sigma factor n=1 Tax=Rhodovulum sp. 12E13 TaxID=2203891 RepID=UPI000E19B6E4|nr:RNA polymerase sigma factor [Rhodovulum sp. 12E13]